MLCESNISFRSQIRNVIRRTYIYYRSIYVNQIKLYRHSYRATSCKSKLCFLHSTASYTSKAGLTESPERRVKFELMSRFHIEKILLSQK